jgi:hypothetical protein
LGPARRGAGAIAKDGEPPKKKVRTADLIRSTQRLLRNKVPRDAKIQTKFETFSFHFNFISKIKFNLWR